MNDSATGSFKGKSPHMKIRWLAGVGLLLILGFVRSFPNGVLAAIVLVFVAWAFPIVLRAQRVARGTALGAAVNWAIVTFVLAMISQFVGVFETASTGRPWSGHVTYLTTFALLATLISVLNARTPGGGAWAILMALLILVFLIPWLEGPGIAWGAALSRLRLDAPWTLFYGLLVLAGVTNYLPTRYGPAALALAVGLGVEYFAVTHPERTPTERAVCWSAVPFCLVCAAMIAKACSRKLVSPSSRLDAIWLWFRDHWGFVWALRVQERFNRSAEALGWPIRIAWQGVVTVGDTAGFDQGVAETTLISLLRRFATPERIAEAVAPSCQLGKGGS